ncbi:hypothetical protein RclHR1_24100001 [Rhizophagus clarus]|uniref:Protein kinase domain-containing protein n=1 Tax=Rhizophagus clarus TaxID=94130 RepID=A0A2Z6RAA2_9GLOM|nr:hypothetical protein RclHR1_24100001 [Rhizophagus clarus]
MFEHPVFGKCENTILDKFIEEKGFKWIPYNKFENVKYLDKGGFGTIYKAIWLSKDKNIEVALKCLNNLNENLDEFLNKQYLVHCDFHDSNILNHEDKEDEEVKDEVFISNLGLCQPIKSFLKKDDIFGVIPFMVPEVLRGKPYTPASVIYSFSMIIICKGKRPKIIKNISRCYVDLMKKCWNENSLKRPSAKNNIMEFINAPIGNNNFITKSHPQAYHTSRLLDFTSRKVDEILKSERLNYILVDNSKNLNEIVDSECLGCIINNIKSPDIKSDQN